MLLIEQQLGEVPSVAILRGMRMLRIVRVIRNAASFRELYLMMMGVATPAVMLLGDMEVMVVALAAAMTVSVTPACSTESLPPSALKHSL